MKSKLYCKILAIGIIVLFIGVGIHPAFAVDTRLSMVNKSSLEDCGCNEVSNADLIKVERLLDRVEFYSKLLLVLSKYNPELKGISEELVDEISKLKTLNDDFPIICDILESITNQMLSIVDILNDFLLKLKNNNNIILYLISVYTIRVPFWAIAFACWYLGTILDCDWVHPH